MCTGTMHRPINGLVDPFSTFHLLRTYNRLVGPVDLAQYYNLSAIKDQPQYDAEITSSVKKSNTPSSERIRPEVLHPQQQQQQRRRHLHSISADTDRRPLIQSPNNRTVTSTTCTSPPPVPYGLLSPEAVQNHAEETQSLFGPKHHHPISIGSSSSSVSGFRQLSPDVHGSVVDAGGSNSVDGAMSFQYLGGRRQRGEKRPIPEEQKDDKYFERRKRNNEAAKKSRDARKMREDRIAFRAAVLEQENSILRSQILALRDEVTTLRQMMCTLPATLAHHHPHAIDGVSGNMGSKK